MNIHRSQGQMISLLHGSRGEQRGGKRARATPSKQCLSAWRVVTVVCFILPALLEHGSAENLGFRDGKCGARGVEPGSNHSL